MKFARLSPLILPAIVAAHDLPRDANHANVARQNAVTLSSSGSATAAATAAAPVGSSTLSSVSFSLASINPTAVPLSDLVAGTLTTQPTLGATTTIPGNTVPTYLPNAPPLPDPASIIPSNYPPLDKLPPTDSPEVQQWIQDVKNSGVVIPDIPVTQPGGCAANPEAAADQSRCWWSCGGCTRSTDITECPTKLTWGLTYDDGPAPYTPNLLQYLDQQNLTATIFSIGSRAISYPNILREEYLAQHQIAVHTWSHPYATTVETDAFIAELGWTKKVIKDILGVTPLYWRPPYGDIDDRIRAISLAMGLTPVMWTRINATMTFDTGDFNIAGGLTSASQVLANWDGIIDQVNQIDSGFIVLEHDLFAQTVDIATGYILPAALANNPPLNIMPVISCLNKPLRDSYVETNDNSTNPLPTNVNSTIPATLSSGAPGSAQATGNSTGGSGAASGNGSSSRAVVAPLALLGSALAAMLVAVW